MQKQYLFVVLLALVASFTAEAEDAPLGSGYFFISADFGVTDNVLDADDYQDESGTSSGLNLAVGYQFNEHVSLGIGRQDYGEAKLFSFFDNQLGNVEYKSNASALTFFTTISTNTPSSNWDAYLTLGLANNDYDLNVEALGSTFNIDSSSKMSFYGGIGATYVINSDLKMIFDAHWNVFSVDGGILADDLGVSSLDVQLAKYGIGLRYSF